ncbi:hypothetical protein WHR41_08046 [Cladosporium halotolerans]|uniref:Oligopeptide transporter n=1 Tax=Cladosporium halotolerans TaxID=1052096 RepID=A0AB34KI77_9PEZI
MAQVTEVIDRPVDLMGNINPDVPPLTEKDNVFLHGKPTEVDRHSDSSLDQQDGQKKGPVAEVGEFSDPDEMDESHNDPFVPFDDLPEERKRVITIRAMLIGSICGCLVGSSNIYLGLKTGWTFGASLFGAIIGFAVLKSLAKALPENFPIFGGSFGPRENNIVQTAATAAGGLSNVFISGIPALYTLNLMSDDPQKDFARLICLTIVGGYFGFAFSTPLRKFFIIYVSRELNLVFPTPSATAMTIRSMHAAATGAAIAKQKMKALSISFVGALVQRVVSQYAPGILWDWHFFSWFYSWGHHNNMAIHIENWGWMVEWTPAFIGVGMLVGLNTALSFFGGSVLAWAIIGPALVHNKMAFGTAVVPDDPDWSDYMNFGSLGAAASNKVTPSPRFWMLWPGVLLMIVVSFTELFLQYKVFWFICKAIYRACCSKLNDIYRKKNGVAHPYLEKRAHQKEDDLVEDPAKPEEMVKAWMWAPMLVLVIICICVVMGVQYDMPIGMSLLSVLLAFIFSFLAIQCCGVTDVTPLTAASKASQVVLGGATKGEHWPTVHAQRLNLLGGSIANMGANQASDLVGDFRVGFLLRTPPDQQWLAQGLGTIIACFLAPALFILFAKAYPCILDAEAETCAFSAPSVAAWRAVAVAVTDPSSPQYGYNGSWAKYRKFHPNFMCIGLAFTLIQTYYGTAMCIGAIPAYFWAKRSPKSFDVYGYAVAAGLIAGEGIGGVINAVFQIAGIAGPDPYGSTVGCPAGMC